MAFRNRGVRSRFSLRTPKKTSRQLSGPSTSDDSPPTAGSQASPRTPRQQGSSPGASAKRSPHVSHKQRRKLFKELIGDGDRHTTPAEQPPAGPSTSKGTLRDFFSRAKPQELVPCPVCREQVALLTINRHLDSGCLDRDSESQNESVPEGAKNKEEPVILKQETRGSKKQQAVSCSPARKIAEMKSDSKDRRTRLKLKRKIESDPLYSSEDRRHSDMSDKNDFVRSVKSPRVDITCRSPASETVKRSAYFTPPQISKQKPAALKSSKSSISKSRLSTHFPEPQGSVLLKKDDSLKGLPGDGGETPCSMESRLSTASNCSTVILSSQDFPEAQDDVFLMYSKSSVKLPDGASQDVRYDTSPEFSQKLSISKSGYLKVVDWGHLVPHGSLASDEEDSVTGTSDSKSGSATHVPSASATTSGIGSESSTVGLTPSVPPNADNLSQSMNSEVCIEDCVPGMASDGPCLREDSNLILTPGDSLSVSPFETSNKPASEVKSVHREVVTPSKNVTKSLETSNQSSLSSQSDDPTGTSSDLSFRDVAAHSQGASVTSPSKIVSYASSQKGTPSKKAAAASSPANSSWKYRDPYFLANFKLILNTVLSNQDDRSLFNEQDMAVINAFRDLSAPSQQLYVRLFQRKHAWLLVAKLDYKKIALDLTPVVAELTESGLIQREHDLTDFEVVLTLCSAPDLKTFAKTLHLSTSSSSGQTKQDLVAALLKHGQQQRSLFAVSTEKILMKKAKKMLGPCIRLSNEARTIFSRLLLLFSLTTDMDEEDKANGGMSQLQTLLLSNMGKVIYPVYSVLRTVQIFAAREDLLRYEAALRYETDIAAAMSTNDFELAYQLQQSAMESYKSIQADGRILSHDLSLPVFLRRFTASWTYVRIFYTGVEILQKRRLYAKAVDTLRSLLTQTDYCQDSRGRWWDRLALNLDQHLKKPAQALDAIKDGLADDHVRTGHRLALQLRAQKILKATSNKRLQKRQGEFVFYQVQEMPRVKIEGRVLPYQAPGIKNTFVREWTGERKRAGDMAICSVEEVALHHYRDLGYEEGVHGEGSTFTTLIFILFWDLVFMEGIPDAFCYPYQSAPLDMRSDAFFLHRQEPLETRLAEIRAAETGELCYRLEGAWKEYHGEQCTGVRWELFQDLQHAQSLLVCLGGEVLSSIAERILRDHRHCRGGMPDLTVWSPASGMFKLVEVKGPGDRLSQKQIMWIDFFLSKGIDAEVCHVTAVGSKRLKLLKATKNDSEASCSLSQSYR